MHNVRKVTEDLYWIGGNDRRLSKFEAHYPIPDGVSYNSYLLVDDKTVLFDTVDRAIEGQFIENIDFVLGDRKLDYIVVNHMEPDHCATLQVIADKYPEATIIGNAKTFNMIKQFFSFNCDCRCLVVKENDVFETANHCFKFVMAPMVHWPEVMVTFDEKTGMLFSADAFGSFKALNGNIFSDEINFERDCLDEARRYYTNIVGKYGMQVSNLFKKVENFDIKMILPLHGPIWRENISFIIEKYLKWASYEAEEDGVVIAYGSIYGNTANAAEILATKLAEKGMKNIKLYDVSVTHTSYILSDCFKYKNLVFAAATYNGGIFTYMENLLTELKVHNIQNKKIALIENGTWGPMAKKQMMELVKCFKKSEIIEDAVTIKSSMTDEQLNGLDIIADRILE